MQHKGNRGYRKGQKIFARWFILVFVFVSVFSSVGAMYTQQASAATKLYWPVRNANGTAYTSLSRGRYQTWGKNKEGKNVVVDQHLGLDINGGKYWYAAAEGTVVYKFTGCSCNGYGDHTKCDPKGGKKYYIDYFGKDICNYGFGNGVIIKSKVDGNYYCFQYAHMDSVSSKIKVGSDVKKGQFLGVVGDRGASTGKHGHFQINKGSIALTSKYGDSVDPNSFSYDKSKDNDLDEPSIASPTVVEDKKYNNYYKITQTNAKLCGRITNPNSKKVKSYGIVLNDGNTTLAKKTFTVAAKLQYKTNVYACIDVNSHCSIKLQPGHTYKYYIFAYVGDRKDPYTTGWKTFKTTGTVTPDAPVFNTSKRDYAIGESAVITWKADINATKGYSVTISKIDGSYTKTIEHSSYKESTAAFVLPEEGEYSISGFARGVKDSATSTMSKTVIAHKPCTVRFVELDTDGNENLLAEQTVKYGQSAEAPTGISRKGHTFTGWDKSFGSVTSDMTITAQFKRNTYKISFYDKDDNLISSSNAEYEGSVEPPEPPAAETGFVFTGWDSNAYQNVQGNASIHASYAWAEEDLPVIVTLDRCEYKDDGYLITYSIKNYPNERTKGRALVSLQTSQNKLLATTESSAFSLAKNEEKTGMEIFVPYEGAATKASIYIVQGFSSGIPISETKTAAVERTWGNWSTEVPGSDVESESRTEYRKKDKQFTTTRTANNSGWTLYDTVIDSNWTWGAWSAYSKTKYTASESTYSKREVQSVVKTDTAAYTQYNYYHYKYWNTSEGCYYYTYSSNMGGTKYTHSTKSALPKGKSFDGHQSYTYNGLPWWLSSTKNVAAVTHTEYRYRDGTKGNTYYWYKWGDWSDWSTTEETASDSRQVETRTTYRTRAIMSDVEDNSGNSYTVSGDVDAALAGQQALIQVFKNNEPSDSNNEYVGQTIIGENGEYEFTFITREDISSKTGDYTVILSIEGATEPIYVKTIEAPKPTYTVTFRDDEGNEIETQTVVEGKSATAPKAPEKEHYMFVGWDFGVTNIRDNMVITAQYAPEKYAVAFVNWETQNASAEVFTYGSPISFPDEDEIEGYEFTGWTTLDGESADTVTGNMVFQANYRIKSYEVNFYDKNENLLDTQTINYGMAAEAPEPPVVEGMVFKEWSTYEFNECKKDLDVIAEYEYEETTSTPSCDTESGTFKTATDIHLSADSDASIYYTLDGTTPTADSNLYNGSITISQNAYLQYIAIAPNKNASEICSATYLVSSGEDDEGALVVKSEEYQLNRGDETTVTYSLWGYEADVDFYSLDEEIASIDEEGVLTANKVGETQVFVRTVDNKYADYANVVVTSDDIDTEEIVLEYTYYAGLKGSTVNLDPEVLPENATNKAVDWYSDNEEIATVSEDGEVTITGLGETVVRAISNDGVSESQCQIKGVESYDEDQITIVPDSSSIYVGYAETFTVMTGNTETPATWSSSDENIATIDSEGRFEALKEGVVTITATLEDGSTISSEIAVIKQVTFNSFREEIEQLPDPITLKDKGTVEALRREYESLPDEEKAMLTEELAALEAAEATIAELEQTAPSEELQQAIEDKEAAERAKAEAEQRAAIAEQAAATAQAEAAAAQQEAAAAQAEAATAQSTLAQTQQELAALQESSEATEEELANAQSNLAQAQAEAAAATQRAATAEAAAAQAEASLAQAEQEVQAANTALAQANEDKQAAEAAASAAAERAAAAEERAAAAEQRAAAAEAALEDLENGTELLEAEERAAAAEAAQAAAEERAAAAEQAAQEAETRAAAAEKALADLQSTKTDITDIRFAVESGYEWNGGEEVCPFDSSLNPKGDMSVLKVNTDYTVRYENNTDVGTAKAIIKGVGDYTGTQEISFKITPCVVYEEDISLSKTKLVYNGKQNTPAVNVAMTVPAAPVAGEDYDAIYPSNSKAVGNYKCIVKFKGHFSGSFELDYAIIPATTKITRLTPATKAFKATWKKQAIQTSGYQIQYSLSSTMKDARAVTVKSNKTLSKTIKSLKSGKKYFVRIRTYKTVNGSKIYSYWSSKMSVKAK